MTTLLFMREVFYENQIKQHIPAAQTNFAHLYINGAVLGLDRLGTVAADKSADFIVLDRNPLENIENSRRIAHIYLRGHEVGRRPGTLAPAR